MYRLWLRTLGSLFSAFWPVVNLCDGLYLLQKEACLMMGERELHPSVCG